LRRCKWLAAFFSLDLARRKWRAFLRGPMTKEEIKTFVQNVAEYMRKNRGK